MCVRLKSLLACLVLACLYLSACGSGSAIGGGSPSNLPISVSIIHSGTSGTIFAGTSAVNLTASVTNDTLDGGVTWTISPATGCGTLTSAGSTAIYVPPISLASNCTATITATSVADT